MLRRGGRKRARRGRRRTGHFLAHFGEVEKFQGFAAASANGGVDDAAVNNAHVVNSAASTTAVASNYFTIHSFFGVTFRDNGAGGAFTVGHYFVERFFLLFLSVEETDLFGGGCGSHGDGMSLWSWAGEQ